MNETVFPELVLASGSPFRAALLANAGLNFRAQPASLDERSVEEPLLRSGMDAAGIAEILAVAKAQDVSAGNPGALVIGGDQTLGLDGRILHKPANMEEALRRLLDLSGKTHQLNSAICIVRDGEIVWSHLETCNVTFRSLDPGFIGRHLSQAGESVLSSVGAYQIEGPGVQLIKKLEGDYFSVMGLPLIPLLTELRRLGAIDR